MEIHVQLKATCNQETDIDIVMLWLSVQCRIVQGIFIILSRMGS